MIVVAMAGLIIAGGRYFALSRQYQKEAEEWDFSEKIDRDMLALSIQALNELKGKYRDLAAISRDEKMTREESESLESFLADGRRFIAESEDGIRNLTHDADHARRMKERCRYFSAHPWAAIGYHDPTL